MLQRCIDIEDAIAECFEHLGSSAGMIKLSDVLKQSRKLKRPKRADWFAIKCTKLPTTQLSGQDYPIFSVIVTFLRGLLTTIDRTDLFRLDARKEGNEDYVEEILVMMQEFRSVFVSSLAELPQAKRC